MSQNQMTEENKLFEVDYNKTQFRIGIDVCKNGHTIYCFDVEPGFEITYQMLVGVLECAKANFIEAQRTANRKSKTVNKDIPALKKKFEKARKKHAKSDVSCQKK